jgi:hypothetical protein
VTPPPPVAVQVLQIIVPGSKEIEMFLSLEYHCKCYNVLVRNGGEFKNKLMGVMVYF